MARRADDDGHRRPRPRPPLPPHAPDDSGGMLTHTDLVAELRAIDGLVDVAGGQADRPRERNHMTVNGQLPSLIGT